MFLLRRNLPRAWAGWRDDFARANENPIQKPWAVWGTQPCTARIESQKLVLGSASVWTNFGGWSYEHTCFTANWGVEFALECDKTGDTIAETLYLIINKPAWTRVGPDYTKLLTVAVQFRGALGFKPRFMVVTFADINSAGVTLAEAEIPSTVFDGSANNIRIEVDDDRFVRVFLNDALYTSAPIPVDYRPSLGSRSVNLSNLITNDSLFDHFWLRDRNPIPPFVSRSWTSHFFDDFNRSNNATVGNGWAEVGQSINIQTNSLAIPSGFPTDGHRYAWQSANPTPSGNMRAEFVFGGSQNPTAQPSSPLLRMNAAGTLAIRALISNSSISIQKITGATNLASPTITNLATRSSTINAGTKVAFSIVGDWAWVENVDDGAMLLLTDGINAHSTDANRYFGAMLYRASFVDSASFNEYRALYAA